MVLLKKNMKFKYAYIICHPKYSFLISSFSHHNHFEIQYFGKLYIGCGLGNSVTLVKDIFYL